MGKHYRAKIKAESEIYREARELLEENKQLKIKLDFFKSVAKQNHEKAQTGEQTLERILFAHSDWAHKIAKEGLEEMKK